jgi:DNA-3-methyladenine glycosylase I
MPPRDDKLTRCPWCGDDPLYVRYHDTEWGVPVRDDRLLFEMLILEGAQAGLSWITVLRKRENYRRALAGFDPEAVARFPKRKIDSLMRDPGLIRNRAKLESAVGNARVFLDVRESYGSFADYLWEFVDGEPVRHGFRSIDQVPSSTPLSDALSKDLKKRGFKFVGTTICYAYVQAVGLVNDHITRCFRYRDKRG